MQQSIFTSIVLEIEVLDSGEIFGLIIWLTWVVVNRYHPSLDDHM